MDRAVVTRSQTMSCILSPCFEPGCGTAVWAVNFSGSRSRTVPTGRRWSVGCARSSRHPSWKRVLSGFRHVLGFCRCFQPCPTWLCVSNGAAADRATAAPGDGAGKPGSEPGAVTGVVSLEAETGIKRQYFQGQAETGW